MSSLLWMAQSYERLYNLPVRHKSELASRSVSLRIPFSSTNCCASQVECMSQTDQTLNSKGKGKKRGVRWTESGGEKEGRIGRGKTGKRIRCWGRENATTGGSQVAPPLPSIAEAGGEPAPELILITLGDVSLPNEPVPKGNASCLWFPTNSS